MLTRCDLLRIESSLVVEWQEDGDDVVVVWIPAGILYLRGK